MRLLGGLWSMLTVAAKRLLTRPGLAIASVLGWTLAVAFVMSIPLYADAIYTRSFLQRVSNEPDAESQRAPLGYLFRYTGSASGARQWEEISEVDSYLSNQAAEAIGLPQQFAARYIQTDPFGLFPQDETTFAVTKSPLTWASFGWVSGLTEHIVISEGRPPEPSSDGPVEALVSQAFATRLGFQVGEVYTAFFRNERQNQQINTALPVQIVGIWYPADASDPFWFYDPTAFDEKFLVSEATFAGPIAGALDDEVDVAVWYLAMDGERIQHRDTDALIRGGNTAYQRATALLPGIELVRSPVEALQAYRRARWVLTVLLYAFSVPIVGLMLVFIGLVSGLSVDEQRTEIAALRSRGATARQVTGLVLLQGVIEAGASLAVGSLCGIYLSKLVGRARGFLDFTLPQSDLAVRLDVSALRLGLVAVGLAIIPLYMLTRRATQHTIVTYRWEQARVLRRPWWQRAALDFLLLIPTAYGLYLLRGEGRIVELNAVMQGDLMGNPLLFLLPSLGLLALTLLSLRLLPALMEAGAWIAAHTPSFSFLMAVRHLARTPSAYAMPWVLLSLTLSLSVFTATLAQTLNTHLRDETHYAVGADVELIDVGIVMSGEVLAYLGTGEPSGDTATQWLFVPVSEYRRLSGVDGSARVGTYTAVVQTPQGRYQGTFVGIDRLDFPSVAFWRDDFAQESLGGLMNALATTPSGVLVPRDFMVEQLLVKGDQVQVVVNTQGQANTLTFTVVGHFDLFPTWYPASGPLFVGNLDFLFQEAGGQFPHSVWLSTQTDTDYRALVEQGRTDLGLRVVDWRAPSASVAEAQQRPERRGLLGVLSIGFAAAGGLTALGFVLYTVFSFERRMIEFGVLRAVGLSSRGMAAVLAWELALLLGLGCGVGTALGAGMARLFIPYYQIGTAATGGIPPYLVEIAWSALYRVYALLGVLFVAALGTLVWALRRMRLFQVIKMGGGA